MPTTRSASIAWRGGRLHTHYSEATDEAGAAIDVRGFEDDDGNEVQECELTPDEFEAAQAAAYEDVRERRWVRTHGRED